MNRSIPANDCIRVLIADPHMIVCEGIAAVLSRQSNMQCVGQAHNGQETVRLITEMTPDVVVMELDFPDMNGMSLIADIHARLPSVSILIFTSEAGDETIYQTLCLGVKGYLFKDATAETMVGAIRSVYSGQRALNQHIADMLASRIQKRELTRREREVLLYITQGRSNQEIADALFISEGTVKSHINRILEKLQVKDRTQAAITAIKRGFVPKP